MLVEIIGESIKLSQLLKKMHVIETGGRAKYFIEVHEVTINGEKAFSRNQKVKPGDILWIDDRIYKIVQKQEQE
ncbi:RNA-binding S4 domain-containing protein [[Mycoplasma] gypis]|uniref:RNA-binding S4 domain-containing protein n=1 Tax=[Mycoplasma] gypis TaxID=92404 RepID=A0ABZ2RQA8_9BACT|nr:RNA-binding S4 domain-containing protein [[Mycoplasma] gypis]MBN0919568.1 RNA-binding S4 domain-containing protein [[Mycoplasma] gypis]